ncbi:hypothetical protein ONS95_011526 [Cadophora gregata]|uniref:uncharacterized protein n=1 Tax=Cadophora gregata TaxID=51156 RepID=UPI0026DB95A5|nr:uncharacterized protein ONS95_011526 [Cadophora gregata]KAK0120118.1 hypothetical protein ONS95_011526 [Cadophora gregata]KAK0121146.1 hypothetical protein ONS96_011325 [Cadophora gregata f. sp. sojae]
MAPAPPPPGSTPKARKTKGSAATKSLSHVINSTTPSKVVKPASTASVKAKVINKATKEAMDKKINALEKKVAAKAEAEDKKNISKSKREEKEIDVATISEAEKIDYLVNYRFEGRTTFNAADKTMLQPGYLY